MTYVIGDIHGCYDEWISLRDKILKEDPKAEFILIGDIIDRGPDTVKMLRWAMENVTANGQYQILIGNHELDKFQIMEHYIKYGYESDPDWYSYYDKYRFIKTIYNDISPKEAESVLEFWKSLPFYMKRAVSGVDFYIAHADIPEQLIKNNELVPKEMLHYRDKESVVWNRDEELLGWDGPGVLIHGHTPTICDFGILGNVKYSKGCIIYCKNRINIDCGMVYWHVDKDKTDPDCAVANLAGLRLEDLKEFYYREPAPAIENDIYRNKILNMMDRRNV